jgi:hypothetical protein
MCMIPTHAEEEEVGDEQPCGISVSLLSYYTLNRRRDEPTHMFVLGGYSAIVPRSVGSSQVAAAGVVSAVATPVPPASPEEGRPP